MTKKVSARQKAMQAQAALLAERAEQDKRVVAAATEWFASAEKIESLQAEIETHQVSMARAVVSLCSEGITVADVATMLEVDQRTVSEMRKRAHASEPAQQQERTPLDDERKSVSRLARDDVSAADEEGAA